MDVSAMCMRVNRAKTWVVDQPQARAHVVVQGKPDPGEDPNPEETQQGYLGQPCAAVQQDHINLEISILTSQYAEI